ncbi:MAG: hypothetical protein E7315_00545 [Clostridiales bacterium]|nr:hypothetical protein [Clostridiales bacterium]
MDYNEKYCLSIHKAVDEKLSEHSERLDAMHDVLRSIELSNATLTGILERLAADSKSYGDRISKLEMRPAGLWDKVIFGVIGALVALIIDALASKIL